MHAQSRLLSTGYRGLFVLMCFLVAVFNFADRAVFAVLAQQLKLDLGLSDFQLGLLQGLAFALLYAFLGLPIGRLAERSSRIRIIAVSLAFWSVMTAACGMITSFTQLLLCRVGVGMGEAGSQPATSSLVGDHFPRERRASIMALIMLGSPLGTLMGAVVGGWVASRWGWRMAFFALGVPGVVLAGLVLVLLREPSRGLVDGLPAHGIPLPDLRAFVRVVMRKRALFLVILGGALAGFGMTSISQFLAVYLARTYHLQVAQAASLYGTISALALTTGLLMGSFGTDWLASRGDPRWPAWGAAAGLFTAPFLYWIAFNAQSVVSGSILLTVAGVALLIYYGPTLGMIQNMLEPRMRATGAALFAILYTIFGYGLGPTTVGWLSDRFAAADYATGNYLTACHGSNAALRRAASATDACAVAAMHGVRSALMVAVSVLFVASILYLLASRSLARDYYRADDER